MAVTSRIAPTSHGSNGVRPERFAARVPFELGLPRVYTVLKLDERRDREQTLDDKVASVERLLGG